MADFLNGYVDVATRLQMALKQWPELRVQESEPVVIEVAGKHFVQVRTTVWRTPDDPLPAIAGTWQKFPGENNFTKDSEMENASTSALGRALGLMGVGIQRAIASRDEVERATTDRRPTLPPPRQRPDSPQEQPTSSTPAQRVLLEKLLRDAGRPAMSGTELEQLTKSEASRLISELKGGS